MPLHLITGIFSPVEMKRGGHRGSGMLLLVYSKERTNVQDFECRKKYVSKSTIR